MEMVTIE